MSATNDGGPAFPVPDSHHANDQVQYGANGMSLRDWFAGQAVCGLCMTPNGPKMFDEVADAAYKIADKMLAARGDAS